MTSFVPLPSLIVHPTILIYIGSTGVLALEDQVLTQRWCVNDRGSNVVLAVRLSAEISNEVFCMDHTIHLIVTKGVKDTVLLRDAMAKCSALAAFLHRSTKNNELLRKKCADLNVAYKKVVLPCPTRWNSQFQCIKSIMDLKVALIALGTDVANISVLLPCSKEFEVLSQAAPFLERFEEASVALSATKVPTIQKVIPALARIDGFLEKALNSNGGSRILLKTSASGCAITSTILVLRMKSFVLLTFLIP